MKLAAVVAVGVAALASTECLAETTNKSVDNAFRVCAILDTIGLLTEKCSVSGWYSTVTAKADISSSQARELCATVVKMARKNDLVFDTKWEMKVYSPYSGGNTIAFCKLSS